MTVRNLDKLFRPQSVAVIGATNRDKAVGGLVMRNLLKGGFSGPIMPVNPKHRAVSGVLTYPDLESLPVVPDLVVVCTPPHTVPDLIRRSAAKGTRAAIVLTSGLAKAIDVPSGKTVQEAMLDAARPDHLRILGPNCLGLLVPGIGLNASFAHLQAHPGKIAFVSQSGALCTAVLDWAHAHNIGFSHFISLGDCSELDFGDVIDYLGSDPDTRAILLYIESIHERRNFMSAVRAAARNKPLLVIKSGRFPEGAQAAASHTGALAGSDDVYDAAFRRAGMLRVYDVAELFAAVETLARSKRMTGQRLAIMTNGGGIGVLAVDSLIESGGQLAKLTDRTIAKLDAVLPDTWSKGNPVDIIGDAPGERYRKSLDILADAPEVDAILVMHAPTATADSVEAAVAVVETAKNHNRNILTCWVGDSAVVPARAVFAREGLATYESPAQAVRAYMHLVKYRKNQELLMETPPSVPIEFTPATATARLIVENALANGTGMMSEPESKALLAAYGIPTVETHIAATPDDAVRHAEEMGYPVALKILSNDITHKSDVGGVDLFLDNAGAVRTAAESMHKRIKAKFPEAKLTGFTVQKMAMRPGAHELIVGVANDPIFGPVILFGQGGTAVEVIGDRTIALPPLNMTLAREMIKRTRVFRLLQGYRDRPAVDMDALCLTLIQVAQMVVDIPEIVELDINPLFCDKDGVLAVDARVGIRAASGTDRRLAIRPYPKATEERWHFKNGREVMIRPIRPEDEPQHHEFISKLTPEDIRFRFFGTVRELPHSEMARLTQIDYDREMAFIASARKEAGGYETLGVVRTVTDLNNERTEFAIVTRSDLKGQGLGKRLLEKMIAYCRARGTQEMVGQVLRDNHNMLGFCQSRGFKTRRLPEEDVVEVHMKL